jgi:hypothetical protein
VMTCTDADVKSNCSAVVMNTNSWGAIWFCILSRWHYFIFKCPERIVASYRRIFWALWIKNKEKHMPFHSHVPWGLFISRPRGSVDIAPFLTSLTDCRWWFVPPLVRE